MNVKTCKQLFTGLSIVCLVISCRPHFKSTWTQEDAPAYFTARFETTKGNFEIESRKEWSPMAVNRLYQLVKHGYFEDMAIYRVIPNYVAQFGIHNDSLIFNNWKNSGVADEPVLKTNTKGTISFARGGPKTRTTNLFINLKNNSPRLDTISFMKVKGFPVVAEVISGMDVVESFYNGYGTQLDNKQDSISLYGNAYLKKNFPKLDYIYKAYITGKQ